MRCEGAVPPAYCRDGWRRKRGRRAGRQSENSHTIFVNNEDAERVQAAIAKLPVEFREIILLREFEKLSHKESADILVCPVCTVCRAGARVPHFVVS